MRTSVQIDVRRKSGRESRGAESLDPRTGPRNQNSLHMRTGPCLNKTIPILNKTYARPGACRRRMSVVGIAVVRLALSDANFAPCACPRRIRAASAIVTAGHTNAQPPARGQRSPPFLLPAPSPAIAMLACPSSPRARIYRVMGVLARAFARVQRRVCMGAASARVVLVAHLMCDVSLRA